MANVKLEDFSVKAKDALDDAVCQFLEEAASELQSQIQEKTPVDTGQLKGSWKHVVDESKKEATIGSPLENAIWTEFGTGEYALEGKGRKGGWLVPAEELTPKAQSKMRLVVIDGKDFYLTYGKRPVRMMHNAFEENRAKIQRIADQIFKERMK